MHKKNKEGEKIRKYKYLSKSRIDEIRRVNSAYRSLYKVKNNVLLSLEKDYFPYDSKIYDFIDELEDETLSEDDVNKICEKISLFYRDFMEHEYSRMKEKEEDIVKKNIKTTIGNNVRGLMQKKNMSNSDLSRLLGIKTGSDYINRIIDGNISIGVERLCQLSVVLGVEVEFLIKHHDYVFYED